MSADLLAMLVKAGGISALAIGVVYLLYSQIIKAGIIPKLRQWQGFTLLCLLAVLIFGVAVVVLVKPQNSPLESAHVSIEIPSKVDLRTSINPEDNPSEWPVGRAVLIHDIVFKNDAEPAHSAYVSGIRATLTLDDKNYPFEWTNFVNMHKEKDTWLAIEADARTFGVSAGGVESREVLHHSNPIQTYKYLLNEIAESKAPIARLSVVSTIDEKSVETICTLNMKHWRGVLNALLKPGKMPARFTMCCLEHPKTKQDSLCGPTP